MINQPPRNGSCSIAPSNGTTSTLFTVLCPDWFDEDGIKDYSVYGKHRIRGPPDTISSSSFFVLEVWSEDVSQRSMVAFTPAPHYHLRLPAGSDNTSSVRVTVQIRDTLNCITQYNLTPTLVVPDTSAINSLVDAFQTTTATAINNNPIIQLLAGGSSNTVAQILTSLSQVFNEMNTRSVQCAVSSECCRLNQSAKKRRCLLSIGGVPAASISISPLGSVAASPVSALFHHPHLSLSFSSLQSSMEVNASALAAFESILNQQAVVRDYLIAFSTNLPINSPNSIALQASTLAQFTAATNQLTRNTAVIPSSPHPSDSHTLDDPLPDARIITMPTTRSCPSILCHQNLIRRCATGSDAYLSVCHQRSQRETYTPRLACSSHCSLH